MQDCLLQHGFKVQLEVLEMQERERLLGDLGSVAGAGQRGLRAVSSVRATAVSDRLLNLVRPYLKACPKPVRILYFDKSPGANWLVPWHQDLTLELAQQHEVPGFGPWSRKDGIPHVQPPAALLEQMLTVRLHLDAADEANGALRVLPGTHSLKRLSPAQIRALRQEKTEHLCVVKAGDALLMRPLLLHASSKSTSPRHRRVLHIEYAGFDLPEPLQWHETA